MIWMVQREEDYTEEECLDEARWWSSNGLNVCTKHAMGLVEDEETRSLEQLPEPQTPLVVG